MTTMEMKPVLSCTISEDFVETVTVEVGPNENNEEVCDGIGIDEGEGEQEDEKKSEQKSQAITETTESVAINSPMEKLIGRHVLQYILEDRPPVDLIISCADGKVGAHRAILASVSPLIGFLLSRRVAGELATIIVPDISIKAMTTILKLCYTGEIEISMEELEEFCSAMATLMIGDEKQFSYFKIKSPEPQSPQDNIKVDIPDEVPTSVIVSLEEPMPMPKTEMSENDGMSNSESTTTTSSKLRPKRKAKPRQSKKSVKRKRNPAKSNSITNDVKKKSKDNKENSSGDQVEDENVKPSNKEDMGQTSGQKTFSGILLTNGMSHVCQECDGIIASKQNFKHHLCNSHGISFKSREVSDHEIEELLQCDVCLQKHTSTTKASQCAKKHGFTKCLTCFGLIPTADLSQHYNTVHGVRTTFALVSKCRWCDLAIAIGNNASKPQSHAISCHINLMGTTRNVNNTPRMQELNPKGSFEKSTHNKNSDESICNESTPQSSTSLYATLKPSDLDETYDSGPPPKRRKVDGYLKPIQLGKRTGAAPLKPSQTKFSYTDHPPSFVTDPTNGKIVGLVISKLPTVRVKFEVMQHLQVNKSTFIEAPVVRNTNDDDSDSQISLTTDPGELLSISLKIEEALPNNDVAVPSDVEENLLDEPMNVSPVIAKESMCTEIEENNETRDFMNAD